MYSFDCSDSPLGNMFRLENLLSGLPEQGKEVDTEIAFLKQQGEDAALQLKTCFPKAEELHTTRERKTRLDIELSNGTSIKQTGKRPSWTLKRIRLPSIPQKAITRVKAQAVSP